VADWDACYKTIVDIIKEKNPLKSRDFNRQVVVFSYFTERAAEAGLVGKLSILLMRTLLLPHYNTNTGSSDDAHLDNCFYYSLIQMRLTEESLH